MMLSASRKSTVARYKPLIEECSNGTYLDNLTAGALPKQRTRLTVDESDIFPPQKPECCPSHDRGLAPRRSNTVAEKPTSASPNTANPLQTKNP